ncbi:MAG: class I SAM-dependent methyltransferase [Proteobacteria bacterium]|nr:class I SAM-dependent methyltransferase [Pseudomonadota bacterium]
MDDDLTNKEYYNRFAEKGYDALMDGVGYRAPSVVCQAALQDVKADEGCVNILDVGIGTGKLSALFRQELREHATITGVDVSSAMLNEASVAKVADRLELLDISCDQLPFSNDEFDLTASCAVFEFMPDLTHAFNEMARVTRPGGLVVLAIEAQGSPVPVGSHEDVHDQPQSPIVKRHRMPTSWFPEGKTLNIYYHSSAAVQTAMTDAGIELLQKKNFVAYQDGGENYIYRLYVGRKISPT